MVQVVEYLLSKCKALTSTSSTNKKTNETKRLHSSTAGVQGSGFIPQCCKTKQVSKRAKQTNMILTRSPELHRTAKRILGSTCSRMVKNLVWYTCMKLLMYAIFKIKL
jgi:hypothetical protein